MQLRLERFAYRPTYTVGRLYANGAYVCDTIEDKDRALTSAMPEARITRCKVYGRTAIPTGTYHIAMDIVSPRFQYRSWARPYEGKLPRLLSVPGFDGVLIHVGNTDEDTQGCILVGENKVVGKVINSTATFQRLMETVLLPAANKKEEITITIV